MPEMPIATIPAKTLSPRWLEWLKEYAGAGKRFVGEELVEVSSDTERELVSLRMALYARALSLFDTSVFLIENDRQLDFRIHSRNVIDTAIYMIKLDSDLTFIDALKDDDFKSRHARASMHLKAAGATMPEQIKSELQAFVDQGAQGARKLEPSRLLEGSDFERLYRSYRDISGDAAHVTVSALNRHYVEHPERGTALLILHPALDEIDMRMTVCETAMAMNICTLLLMPQMEKSPVWDQFREMTARYREMIADGSDFLVGPDKAPASRAL